LRSRKKADVSMQAGCKEGRKRKGGKTDEGNMSGARRNM